AAIEATFEEIKLKEGTAWTGHGSEFFFAVDSDVMPTLVIDDFAPKTMGQLGGSHFWYAAAEGEPRGRLHSYLYLVGGSSLGGSLDLPALTPASYQQQGVPTGTL